MKVIVGGAGQPSPCQAVTPWDTLLSQDPQTGPRGLLPRVHCPSRGHIPAIGDSGGCQGPGLTPHASGTTWTPHPICGRASPKCSPLHPTGHPARGGQLLPIVLWRLGVPAVGRGLWGRVAPPPSPLALLTARAVQKALGSAISHAASEHAARLFPGEQRRQLLPSCSTSLPHLLAPNGGGRRSREAPPGPTTPAPSRESPPEGGERRTVERGGQETQQWGNVGLCVAESGPFPHPAQPPGPRAARTTPTAPPAREGPSCPPVSFSLGKSPGRPVGGFCRARGTPRVPPAVSPGRTGLQGPPAQLFAPLPALLAGGCLLPSPPRLLPVPPLLPTPCSRGGSGHRCEQ